jgi:DNA primase
VIPEETVERVREAADIVQIVGEHVKLRRMGRNYRGPCPLHGGKNPNFSVSPDKGVYHCFTCQESGNVFTFLEKMLGVDYPTAIRMIADRVGIEVVETQRRAEEKDSREPMWELNATAAQYFQRSLWEGDAGAAARAYLESRGIARAVADRFGLGYAPPGNALRGYLAELGFTDERMLEVGLLSRREDDARSDPYPRFRDRLTIPIHDTAGHPVGFGARMLAEREGAAKYLNSPETKTFQKRRLLYNLHQAKHAVRRADRALLVEGYFDVVRLASAGVEEVVAPLGTALTDEQAALLTRYTKNVFLLYDSDEAGQKATFRSGLELLALGVAVRVVSLPDGEDPDSYVSKFGREKLERQIESAIDVFELQLRILQRRGWFADLHRRRRAIDRLLPTIRQTADRLTRDIYVARLSEAAGVAKELLLGEIAAGDPRDRAAAPRAGGSGAPRQSGGSAQDRGGEDFARPPEPFDDGGGAGGGARRSRFGDRRKGGGRRDGEWRSLSAPPRGKRLGGFGAERELTRLMLHVRPQADVVLERYGPEDFRHPAFRAIFDALRRLGPEAPVDALAEQMDEGATAVMQALLAEAGAVGDPDRVREQSFAQLEIRALVERNEAIDARLGAASDAEQDALMREKIEIQQKVAALGGIGYTKFGKSGR